MSGQTPSGHPGAVNGDPAIHEPLAGRVNVIDRVGEVAKITTLGIVLRIPVVGQLDHRVFVAGRGQEHQREAPTLIVDSLQFTQPEQVTVECEGSIDVADPHHGV